MERLAQRINNLSESETLAMARKSRELTALGINVINLSIGEPDFNTPDHIKQAAIRAIHENKTHYPPVPGYPELRKAICDKLLRDNQLQYKPDEIVVSSGAKHSIANAIICMVNPGDEVIVPAPYWVSYRELVKLARGTSVFIETSVENDYKFTPEQLEAAITPRSKVLIFSSPCNPSGSVFTRGELAAMAEVVARHPGLFVISDEIYELINFCGKHESIAQFSDIREQVILINGVSKGFAMTGWRLGYMAAPRWIASACDKLQGQMTSAPSSISQYAALEAMQTDPAGSPELQMMVRTFRERRDAVLEALKSIPGLKANTPSGAFYVLPEISSYFGKSCNGRKVENATDLCNYLLEEAHVALVAGDAFGVPGCIRISYANSLELINTAMGRIRTALAALS